MRFLTIIELPKSAYHIVKTPSAGERLLHLLAWGLTQIVLALIAFSGRLVVFNRKRRMWTHKQAARYRLTGILASICLAVIAEETIFALFTPLIPAVSAAG